MSRYACFWEGVGGGWQEESPTSENEHDCSFSGGGGGGTGQGKVHPTKTSGQALFRGGVGKRKAQPSKMSGCARLRGVWVVVLARGRSNPQKQALWLVFGGAR